MDSPYPDMEAEFKRVWADNADAMSQLYSGTPALKTDFTRTGKRTLAGMMADGKSSVARYFLNNFHDGRTQDAWDLLLGRFSIRDDGITDEARRLLPAGAEPAAKAASGSAAWAEEGGMSPRAAASDLSASSDGSSSTFRAGGGGGGGGGGRPRAMSANISLRRGRHATSTASVLGKIGLFAAGIAAVTLAVLAFVHVAPQEGELAAGDLGIKSGWDVVDSWVIEPAARTWLLARRSHLAIP